MTGSDLIIISIVRRSNFDSSGAEFHVDDNGVRDNWDSPIDERVGGEFSVKVLQFVQTSNAKRVCGRLLCTLGRQDGPRLQCLQA